MSEQKVTVGRIVYYTNLGDADGRYPPTQQAAIVTKVHDLIPVVSLAILYPTGLFFVQDVEFSVEYKRGHWSWPKQTE